MSRFNDKLSTATWSAVESKNDTQMAYDIFHAIYFKIFDDAFPLQRTKNKSPNPSKSWLTNGLKRSIAKKHKLYCEYLTSPTPLFLN